jgi:hypothetical protein
MNFFRALAIRASRTAAQTAVALLGTGAFNIIEVDWQQVLGVSAGAALVSALTSIATGLPEAEG